jgi:hypothetical protein
MVTGVAWHVVMHSDAIASRITLCVSADFLNVSNDLMAKDRWSHPHTLKFLQVRSANPTHPHLDEEISPANPRQVDISKLEAPLRINESSFQGEARSHL